MTATIYAGDQLRTIHSVTAEELVELRSELSDMGREYLHVT